jgi:hypothetical protein
LNGRASQCKDCRKKTCDDWYARNRDREKPLRNQRYLENKEYEDARNAAATAALREKVLDHYGRKCACCGEKHKAFLTTDHVDGKGNLKARDTIRAGHGLWRWLIKNNFPPGFQTLCYNCNIGKYRCGVCPHKTETPLQGIPFLVERAG